jgi:hypothetical protein
MVPGGRNARLCGVLQNADADEIGVDVGGDGVRVPDSIYTAPRRMCNRNSKCVSHDRTSAWVCLCVAANAPGFPAKLKQKTVAEAKKDRGVPDRILASESRHVSRCMHVSMNGSSSTRSCQRCGMQSRRNSTISMWKQRVHMVAYAPRSNQTLLLHH